MGTSKYAGSNPVMDYCKWKKAHSAMLIIRAGSQAMEIVEQVLNSCSFSHETSKC